MAEVTSSASSEGFSAVSTSSTAQVVAPPKFVFGSGMSKRVKQKNMDDDSDTSEQEEEQTAGSFDFLEYASAAVKRSADSDNESEGIFPDFPLAPKKIKTKESAETKSSSVLRPSALSAIAQKLTHPKEGETNTDTVKDVDHLAQTRGESSNSNSSSESSTTIQRPHLIDTPASLNSGTSSQNYFQQFMSGTSSSSTSESKGAFVFGQNIRDRVNVEMPNKESKVESTAVNEQVTSPKSLADVADTATKADSDAETATSSIAAAAQKYESEHSPPKNNLAEIHVMTGEEDERNVIQVSCRLFVFCKETHSWLGRGRATLKLNDHCTLNAEGTFHSRLVARTQGTLRLVLNTKLWSEMVVEKASDKAIRVSAMEDGVINLYLIMAAPREALQLYTAIDRRIETLKREKANQKESEDESAESCKNKECEQKQDKEEDLKETKRENDDKENDKQDNDNDTLAAECQTENDSNE